MINMDDFLKCDLRVGQILSAAPNPKARVPASVLQIDFGDALGVLQSSAQLCDNYQPHDLVGKKIIAVVNFPAKKVAGISSQVLVLAAVCAEKRAVLLTPDLDAPLGTRVA